MAHRYGHVISVDTGPDGAPTAFTWQGQHYRITEVWHGPMQYYLTNDASVERAAYSLYRVCVKPGPHFAAYFELFHDPVGDSWVLVEE